MANKNLELTPESPMTDFEQIVEAIYSQNRRYDALKNRIYDLHNRVAYFRYNGDEILINEEETTEIAMIKNSLNGELCTFKMHNDTLNEILISLNEIF